MSLLLSFWNRVPGPLFLALLAGAGAVVPAAVGAAGREEGAIVPGTFLQVVLRFRKVLKSLCSSPTPAISARGRSSVITQITWLQLVCRSSCRAACPWNMQ